MKSIGENSVSDDHGVGFREFSSCEELRKRSRRRLNKVARRGAGTDCARSSHTVSEDLPALSL